MYVHTTPDPLMHISILASVLPGGIGWEKTKPNMDSQPILKVQFSYAGTAAQASEWLNRFTDLKPAAIRKYESIPFTQVLSAANADVCSGIWYATVVLHLQVYPTDTT